MSEPGFQQIEKLFHEALALLPEERNAFLDSACASNVELRAAVEELLRHDDDDPTDKLLVSPAAHLAAGLRPTHDLRGDGAFSTGAPLPDIPGYEIWEELGRGGMGVVYKARQISLDRFVALKMLLPGDMASAEKLGRFRSEAEALARLHHPHIIPIYEIGVQGGLPWFTMEYIAGPSLAQVLDGRPQEIADSARLLETLARTIHTVHQHGILHRDLKPANILLVSGGLVSENPKITDFGLAKDQTVARNLTESGMAMGTPCYMAPEQARGTGGQIGPAVDIYALGSIFYEMLTGRPPFDAPTTAETITQLLHEDPVSPLRLRPRLPRDLATICLKCLEKMPAKRYASALDLAEDLRLFQAGEPIQARPVGVMERAWRWCRRRPLVAGLSALSALLTLVLLATVLIYNYRLQEALARAENKTEEQRLQIIQLNINIGTTEMEKGDAFTALLRFTEALRLDAGFPDSELEHRRRIGIVLRQCPRPVQVRMHNKLVLGANLHADFGWLILADGDRRLEICDVLTGRPVGAPVVLADVPTSTAISSDGRSLATIHAGGKARLWDLTTNKSRELPCERALAVVFHKGEKLLTQHPDSVFRMWDLGAKEMNMRRLSGAGVVYAVLSDNAHWLCTFDRTNLGQVWEVATGEAIGKPVAPGHAVSLAGISPDGRHVAVIGPDKAMRVWNVAAAEWSGKPIRPKQPVSKIVVSPDGSRVLVTTTGGSQARVWEGATGQALTPPLRHGGPLSAAGFIAAGKQVATVGKNGMVSIWELPGAAQAKGDLPDLRPIEHLTTLARVLAGGRIDERQQWQALGPGELLAAWKTMQQQRLP